jgi:hypothetical protein
VLENDTAKAAELLTERSQLQEVVRSGYLVIKLDIRYGSVLGKEKHIEHYLTGDEPDDKSLSMFWDLIRHRIGLIDEQLNAFGIHIESNVED